MKKIILFIVALVIGACAYFFLNSNDSNGNPLPIAKEPVISKEILEKKIADNLNVTRPIKFVEAVTNGEAKASYTLNSYTENKLNSTLNIEATDLDDLVIPIESHVQYGDFKMDEKNYDIHINSIFDLSSLNLDVQGAEKLTVSIDKYYSESGDVKVIVPFKMDGQDFGKADINTVMGSNDFNGIIQILPKTTDETELSEVLFNLAGTDKKITVSSNPINIKISGDSFKINKVDYVANILKGESFYTDYEEMEGLLTFSDIALLQSNNNFSLNSFSIKNNLSKKDSDLMDTKTAFKMSGLNADILEKESISNASAEILFELFNVPSNLNEQVAKLQESFESKDLGLEDRNQIIADMLTAIIDKDPSAKTAISLDFNETDGVLKAEAIFKVKNDAQKIAELISSIDDTETLLSIIDFDGNISIKTGVNKNIDQTVAFLPLMGISLKETEDGLSAEIQIKDGTVLLNGEPIPL